MSKEGCVSIGEPTWFDAILDELLAGEDDPILREMLEKLLRQVMPLTSPQQVFSYITGETRAFIFDRYPGLVVVVRDDASLRSAVRLMADLAGVEVEL
jgi:hypothetical protein